MTKQEGQKIVYDYVNTIQNFIDNPFPLPDNMNDVLYALSQLKRMSLSLSNLITDDE